MFQDEIECTTRDKVTQEFDNQIMEYERLISDYKQELQTLHSTFDTELEKKLTTEKQKLEEDLKTKPSPGSDHVTKLEDEIQVSHVHTCMTI